MIQLQNQELMNEQLVLDNPSEVHYLGHNLTLRDCTLVIKVPARALVIARAWLIGCTVETQRTLKGFLWDWAHLRDCQFRGRYSSNDFGTFSHAPAEGSIAGCNFTQAQLDGCRFFGCDVNTLSFPSWPCFTLLEPGRRRHELGALPWPGKNGALIGKVLAQTPVAAMALTYSAPSLAKRCGTTPEAIKAVLEKLGGVSY